MTVLVPAYDVESPGDCLAACRDIVAVHRRMNVPAVFFIVGKLLEVEGQAYRDLLADDPLFEVASHTYSHRMLRDHPICGPAVSREEIISEVRRGVALVEEVFRRPCLGIRPGCGFSDALSGAGTVLEAIASAGCTYVSSRLWGPHCTLPAPLVQAYHYGSDGFVHLWEFPGHGWHENGLKGHNATPGRLLLWPPVYPDHQPSGYVRTPDEEFAVHRYFVDRAAAEGLEYVSLIWHPWSLRMFDPAMRMLELLFAYTREQGIGFARFADLRRLRS